MVGGLPAIFRTGATFYLLPLIKLEFNLKRAANNASQVFLDQVIQPFLKPFDSEGIWYPHYKSIVFVGEAYGVLEPSLIISLSDLEF